MDTVVFVALSVKANGTLQVASARWAARLSGNADALGIWGETVKGKVESDWSRDWQSLDWEALARNNFSSAIVRVSVAKKRAFSSN